MRVSRLLLSAAACALVPGFAFAQEAGQADPQSNGGLEEIIVTAQKREQNMQDVPVAVTALSGETLTNRNVASVSDLPRLAPSGRYVMIGQPPPGKPVCINAARHLFDGEGKTIKATQGGGFRPDLDVPRYLRMASELFVHGLIQKRLPLSEINQAFDLVRAGESGRVLVEMPT